jgi:uncharacterized protein YbjT (DUF2867 family)
MAMKVLVTGATGYVGGRLVPRLLERGHDVRLLVRDPARVAGRPWADRVELARANLLEPESLAPALDGIEAAFYLVHSMSAGREFASMDARAARAFAAAAVGVRLVIYLGGLMPEAGQASTHLASRAEVGKLLRAGLPTTELRAGPIIGAGSASFEMVRYLTERLPVMVAPRWVGNPVQPVAVRDVLSYLLAALEREPLGVVEIGGDALSFKQMMEVYAQVRGLRRMIVPVPVLAPGLAARWVGLVTPIPNRLAVPIIEGVIHPLLADTARARLLFPVIQPLTYRSAVEEALGAIERGEVETRWSGALGSGSTVELSDREGLIREVRSVRIEASPQGVFETFSSLGGDRGWLVWNWAWWLRGLVDRVTGGPGLRRGRRHPRELLAGEAVDFWRVEMVVPPRLLRLRAEMNLPGRAWLQWEAVPDGDGTRLVQTALFAPVGLAGALYWNLLYPAHRMIFSGLVRAIAREAMAEASRAAPAPGERLQRGRARSR